MEDLKIRIISEPSEKNPFVVLYKPHNLPSAPLSSDDKNNALYQASCLFPEILDIHGRKEIEKGLVHRLDTVTSGLLLIATKQDFYDKLLELQNENLFIKYYRANCSINPLNGEKLTGFPLFSSNSLTQVKCNDIVRTESYFRPFGEGQKQVRPVTENSGQAALKKLKNKVLYNTQIKIMSIDAEKAEVLCTISKGYRHQVRCHLAWAGLPVINDPLYNYDYIEETSKDICFEACRLEFPHPYTGEKLVFEI